VSNRSPGSNPGFSAKNPGNVAFPGFFVCCFFCGEKAVNALTKFSWIQANPSPKRPMKNQRPSSVNPQARQGHHHSSCAKNPQNDKPHAFISFHRGEVLSE
jgi:hypothetical protein